MATITNRPQTLGAGYAVSLPAFSGPLDLLLHLIETQELDISAISLMTVTEQYLQTLAQLEEIEPGALADFLVVASRLLYIKSHHLLPKPRPPVEDEEEASGDALVRQLLEYRRFKEVAGFLRGREEQGLRVYVRTVEKPEVERRLDMSGVDLAKLQQALRRVLDRLPSEAPAAAREDLSHHGRRADRLRPAGGGGAHARDGPRSGLRGAAGQGRHAPGRDRDLSRRPRTGEAARAGGGAGRHLRRDPPAAAVRAG